MDYLYEALGDERFQEFCSCLVSKEFPNIQTFPVGQPDGGRDIVSFDMNDSKKEFVVFQVKFVRNGNQERDVVKWIKEIIAGEEQKINRLIKRGAKKYYILTNLKGSAHLDDGSKDKINKLLEETIKIPALCWWRDDITALLNKDPIFKWSFPEILNGQDILNAILFENISENRERRENVVKAYLTDQYEIDKEVKFRQIELQNRLLSLFTDVPLKTKKINERNKALKETIEKLVHNKATRYHPRYRQGAIDQNEIKGAASFLLHPTVQSTVERVLLEGGPGQGKSTISQYVCQVHRIRLLNNADRELLPQYINKTPIRLPFKIDLRDIALWVEKKNPYQNILSQEYFESIWRNSLEAFLVGHIFFHSKLEEFNSTDFIAVCKYSPILFVFDGFDEIANMKVRGDVIEFINKGITRISANAKSVQVIITSRPAAFTDSVEFSVDNYPHFELADITPTIINEYVEKWIKSSNLTSRDATELRSLVKSKLELPHLKDLAKSPMQLAILISLLRTKGQSLPNKRTALYDSYINLFFDRESEKSGLIRERRDLVIAIHQYLAWVLHSEAELYKSNGRISIDELNKKVKEYLSKEGHDPSITDQLFNVMKERVCALVSRIQGTFEFEVQPLREYFCAKYLYESAPHSSTGAIKSGTKPDRLHALLRNFYWQNVVRFFTGCAGAGELDMIAQELKDLQSDLLLSNTNYPILVTSKILSDYVFVQKPLKAKQIVQVIVDAILSGGIISQGSNEPAYEALQLPYECGGSEIVKACFLQLSRFPHADYAAELISVINNNPYDVLDNWKSIYCNLSGNQLTRWMNYAQQLNLIEHIDEQILLKVLTTDTSFDITQRLQIILNANQFKVLEKYKNLKELAFDGMLNGQLRMYHRKSIGNSLFALSIYLNPSSLIYTLKGPSGYTPYVSYFATYADDIVPLETDFSKTVHQFDVADDIDRRIYDFVASISSVNFTTDNYRNSLEPWDNLVENGRRYLHDCWSLSIIATLAAGIKSKEEAYEEFDAIEDKTLSLCKRVRCARMKSGNVKYWESTMSNSKDTKFVLLVLLTWATPKTILELLPQINHLLESLSPNEFSYLLNGLKFTTAASQFTKSQQNLIEQHFKGRKNYHKVKLFLSFRSLFDDGVKFLMKSIGNQKIELEEISSIKLEYLIDCYLSKTNSKSLLKEIKEVYANINDNGFEDNRFVYNRSVQTTMPISIADMIMTECSSYPRVISSIAEMSFKIHASKLMRPVGEVSKNEKWFEND